jgi:preprotein translocase subunit SecE
VRRLRRYLQESWSELKKVAWPTRDQVRNLTVLVFVVSAAVGVFIAFWDLVFTEVVRLITPA